MVFPLKRHAPFNAKSAMKAAISLADLEALNCGKADLNISVSTEPSASALDRMPWSFNSSARHSVRPIMADLLEL